MTTQYYRTKTLWRDLFALASISDAARFLDLIEKAISDKRTDIEWPLWIAFITSYARPFTTNDDMGRISDKGVPAELRRLHDAFLVTRNGFYGHTDPLRKMDDGTNINRIVIAKKGGFVNFVAHTLRPHFHEIPKVRQLVDSLLDDLKERTQNGRDYYAHRLSDKPDGDYLLPYPIKTDGAKS